jgi:hypothetical protein
LTAGVFILGSLVLQKAFWARHFAPVFPFYVTLLGLAIAALWQTAWSWRRALPLGFGALLIFSSLNFRFALSLRKEDYRAAAAFVRPLVAAHQSVWWLAGAYPATYYGLPYSVFQPAAGKVFLPVTYAGELRDLPLPEVIVYNKPYIHDPAGAVQKIIEQNHYREAAHFQSFTVWTNSPAR